MKLNHTTTTWATALLLPLAPLLAQDEVAEAAEATAEAATEAVEVVAEAAAEAPNSDMTHIQKVSYFFGSDVARSLTRNGVEGIDADVFMEAFNDVLAGRDLKLSEAEIEETMNKFSADMQAKQAEKAANAGAENKEAGEAFLAENGKREGVITTESGLQYEVVTAGEGAKPTDTDTVRVHYHGTLIDGKVFDSSVERGESITFGVGQVIKGWTEALKLMPVGSKYKLFIPSELAYGERGAGNDIGPHSALIFDVELIGIE